MAMERAMTYPEDEMMEEAPIEVEIGEEAAIEDVPEEDYIDDGHRSNLADFLSEEALTEIGSDLVALVEADARSRDDWISTYVKGLDYLGFSMEDRDKPFKGASGVFHPVMSEAVVRFQSNAIMEIFPAAGPVLTRTMGEDTNEKVNQARRVKDELNYQLTENMSEYRNETEQLLFRLPLAGSVFKKVYYDPLKKRPSACMVPAEDFVVDYDTTELENAERKTHILRRSPNMVKKLQRSGFYRQVDLPKPVPTYSEAKEKEDELGGSSPSMEVDSRLTLYEVHLNYNLPEPFADPDDIADPYIVTIDKASGKVLSIYRNWAEDDDQDRNCDQYFVHYQYMPGLGFYGVGLIHLLGSIAKATTSILRQLIDAGTLANLPGGLKAKGLRVKGDDTPIQPGEWRDVDVTGGAIRDSLLPLPYKEPSMTLVNLLTMLVEEGRRIGSIADVQVGAGSENAPVGTTLALMERSLKVMSAVHARLHASLRRELKLIAKCIFEYMPEQYEWDIEGMYNRRQDFDGRVDVLPVSDPNAATQAQKIVQMQAVQQLAAMNPELYNLKELHRAGLQAIGIKNDERILPMDQDPPRMDPVQENMAILTSQPVKVYPEQDHTAHIQVHLSMFGDPKILELVQASPNAPKLQGQMEAHLAEHLAFQYRSEIEQALGEPLPPMGEELPPEVEAQLSRLVAEAAVKLRDQHEAEAAEKEAEEAAKDPIIQIKEREVGVKERKQTFEENKAMTDAILKIATAVSKEGVDLRRIESEETRAGAKIGADLVTFGAQLESEERREGVTLGKEIAENIREDQRTIQQLTQEMNEREADRQNKIEIAKLKPKPKPASKT